MFADRYGTLISSLPYPGELFKAKQTPLSRLNLDARLRSMLNEEDAALLCDIEDLVHWINQPIERTDAAFVKRARHLIPRIDNELIRELVEYRLELRTAMAALRRRKRGESAPRPGEPWGYGRWLSHIQRYWSEPAFRLEGVFPWLAEANRLLKRVRDYAQVRASGHITAFVAQQALGMLDGCRILSLIFIGHNQVFQRT